MSKNEAIDVTAEGYRPFNATMTVPRMHTRPSGERELVIDMDMADEKALEVIDRAVAGWLKSGVKVRRRRSEGTDKGGIRRWSSFEDKPVLDDVLGVGLVRHVKNGPRRGSVLKRPFLRLVAGNGMRYEIDTKGRALATCHFCGGTYGPFRKIEGKDAHRACVKRAVQERQRRSSVSVLEGLTA